MPWSCLLRLVEACILETVSQHSRQNQVLDAKKVAELIEDAEFNLSSREVQAAGQWRIEGCAADHSEMQWI